VVLHSIKTEIDIIEVCDHYLVFTNNKIQCLVCHAELNAILNKNCADTRGCTMYVAMFPCNECAKLVIQSGIKEVVYVSDKYCDKPEFKASRILLHMAGVKHRLTKALTLVCIGYLLFAIFDVTMFNLINGLDYN